MTKPKTMTATEFGMLRKRIDAKARPFVRFATKRKPGPGRPPSQSVTQHALAGALGISKRTVERYENGSLPIPSEVAVKVRSFAISSGRKVAA